MYTVKIEEKHIITHTVYVCAQYNIVSEKPAKRKPYNFSFDMVFLVQQRAYTCIHNFNCVYCVHTRITENVPCVDPDGKKKKSAQTLTHTNTDEFSGSITVARIQRTMLTSSSTRSTKGPQLFATHQL